jgi:hypothetical protein
MCLTFHHLEGLVGTGLAQPYMAGHDHHDTWLLPL